MAKLSGFFMSTLLILLCLWINVCHYPDATRGASSNGSEGATPDAVAPSDAPAPEPLEESAPEEDSAAPSGLLADVAPAPKLLDVSADPAATQPVLEPASFPGDGAEIDDAPQNKADVAEPANEQTSNAAPQNAPASVAPRRESQTASPAVATPTQDVRRSETKPSGAKYVRVPESEIDAFSGGVRSARSTNDESRVVGAHRAGQTNRAASPAL